MNDIHRWQQENRDWGQDHANWLREVDAWSKQAKRLVGLLYKLEHAIPEHSARLAQHVARINDHDADIKRYECGLDPRCLKDCDSFIGNEEQRRFHQKLAGLHELMQKEHADFNAKHKLQIQQLRQIALQLLDEIGPD